VECGFRVMSTFHFGLYPLGILGTLIFVGHFKVISSFLPKSQKLLRHFIFASESVVYNSSVSHRASYTSCPFYLLEQCFSNRCPRITGGLRQFARRSARRFRKKGITKIVSDTKRVKNTTIRICAKSAFVG
jgi:hypothetical protein